MFMIQNFDTKCERKIQEGTWDKKIQPSKNILNKLEKDILDSKTKLFRVLITFWKKKSVFELRVSYIIYRV